MSPPIKARVTGCPPENWMTSRLRMPYFSKYRPSWAAQSGACVALKIVPARNGSCARSNLGETIRSEEKIIWAVPFKKIRAAFDVLLFEKKSPLVPFFVKGDNQTQALEL